MSIHSSILMHAFIHSSHTSKHHICNYCVTMLRVVSRSGSHLIRYERQLTKVPRPAHEGLEAASHQTEPGEKNRDEPQRPCSTPLRSGQGHLDLSCSILTSSQAYRISIEVRPVGHLSWSLEQHGHLPRGGLRSSGMPHEGYADPVINDGSRFHSTYPLLSSSSA